MLDKSFTSDFQMMCPADWESWPGMENHPWSHCYIQEHITKWKKIYYTTYRIQLNAGVIFCLETWITTHMKIWVLSASAAMSVLNFVLVENARRCF